MNIQKAVLKIGKINKNSKDTVEYYDMPVQYNPSTLSLSSRAGLIEEEGPGEAGIGSRKSAVLPPETSLSVELIFEAIDNDGAFLSNTKQQKMEEALGKKRSYHPEAKQKAEGPEDFVQRQVDGLLSLVMQVSTKQVVFIWGDMNFGGELEDVSARYTMFGPKGNPIRASVDLTIRQAASDSDSQMNSSEEAYWKDAWKSFKKLAGKQKEEQSLTGQYESAQELLSLNE